MLPKLVNRLVKGALGDGMSLKSHFRYIVTLKTYSRSKKIFWSSKYKNNDFCFTIIMHITGMHFMLK